MNELALFAGVGGGLLGTHLLGWRPLCAVEIASYCREVLLKRQRDLMLPLFPIWDDIKTFNGKEWHGQIDVVTGGFPCQPFSVAGKQKGEADERNLWPDTIRVIRKVGPRFCLLENVPGLLVHPYFGTILGDLAESGYHARWTCLGADDIGGFIERKRLFILGWNKQLNVERLHISKRTNPQNEFRKRKAQDNLSNVGTSWLMANGYGSREIDDVAHRVDRLKAIGNGQVPSVVKAVWELMTP